MPKHITKQLCPCCSEKLYSECCKVFHDGKLAENALQLMRSRYSAYALNLPHYIISTTHPENVNFLKNFIQWKENISKFTKSTSFRKLEIHNFTENGNQATVLFTAHLYQNNRDATFTEMSDFVKVNNAWLYLRGQVY